jgi:hypothetical protein
VTKRVFLNTNVYIIGAANLNSNEGKILQWLGFVEKRADAPIIILSEETVLQILCVARRLQGKD